MTFNKKIKPINLLIEYFRSFKNVSLELGRKITVISGQNGVGKSNILSLIASGSGINKNSHLGSNFQPEFYKFFNVDSKEDFENYRLYLKYAEEDGNMAFVKRLSFKDDTRSNRGIRIIPRTYKDNPNDKNSPLKQAQVRAKTFYGVGESARVPIPTIYLSLSRLYPLGECKNTVIIREINKKTKYYQKKANEKYKEWYNFVIPNSIKDDANLSVVKKETCSRASFHMDINNTPTLSQSIGQDNLGNIISALVDIFMLSLEQDYNGAIICIDEIDVSLHPDTQIKLLYLLEKVSSDLNIQFIISSHSLTILKEMLNKEKKNNKDYKVVYLKSPSAPYVTNKKSYELLKADMFQSLEFQQPKVKIYFEDEIGKALFNMLFKAFREIYKKLDENKELPCFKYCSNEKKYNYLKEKIIKFKTLLDLPDRVNEIITHLGCEELVNISDADSYFKRVIILLDGDARYKQTEEKPRIKDYLIEEFNSSSSQNDRKHGTNICFLPNYFAPESFLYAIIYKLYTDPIFYSDFWRTLDDKESTALFTPEKIKNLFSNLESDFNNDDLKKIFKEYNKSEVWKFIIESDLITYYYSKFNKIEELLLFLESLDNAYKMTLPLTLSNRYT